MLRLVTEMSEITSYAMILEHFHLYKVFRRFGFS